jgi:catechol 2,3-dioxygenase-like lactoylglutathione lyase family enzyme
MKLEHFAINVENPIAMAEWYVKNLGLKIVRQQNAAPFTHFLADDSGQIMIEIYMNPPDQVPPYRTMDPLILHLAFVSDSPENDKNRLLASGATFDSEVHLEDGSLLVMMRDPWGLAFQLCKRGIPMLGN